MNLCLRSERPVGANNVCYKTPRKKTMPNLSILIFGILSLVFAFFSARDYLREGGTLSLSARVWLRIAVIFAAVAVLLLVLI
jgi:hypothetical protein